jgi:polar amino acid transport system substrate-binding protein
MSGITYDILEEIAKRENITINYTTEVTRATLVETLNTNRVAMIASPVRITPEREANADFSDPFYYSPIGAYTRVDDMRFNSVEKINNPTTKIIAIDGEGGQVIARSEYS